MRACRRRIASICRRSGRRTVEVAFKTKPAIAHEHLRWACAAGLPRGVVLMDAGYGADTDLRTNITALGLSYVAGIMPQTSVWAPGTGPQPPKNWSGCGRPPKLLRRDGKHQPISVKKLAFALPSKAWRKITWREATAEPLSSRFARVRVRAAHRDYWLAESRPEEWLLIEWPEGEEAPTKYWFSTLPANIAFHQLVDTAKLRWRIERDYQELKQEVGLGHFEGRGWRGFHHHATLCIAAYGFLVSERETIPPLYGALGVKHKLSMWQLGIGIETADMSTNTSQVAAACGPTPTWYARDDSRGARHLAPFIAPQPCIRWIHWDPDHDATMRIGGEAPGRRAHSQERL